MSSKNIIETPRLLIRIDSAKDYIQIFESFDDTSLKRYFGLNDEELATEKEKVSGGMQTYRTSFALFHLIEKATHNVLGSFAFHNWYKIHSRAEIGYALRKEEYKNRGFMKEAIMPILDYGFNKLNLNRMEAFIGPNNIASQKTVLRQGFKHEGVLKEHYCKNDVIEDSWVYGLLRKDYLAGL
jgi:ribosomal-protein-alanine N-acetyltransferase